jgi:hypothetical protein
MTASSPIRVISMEGRQYSFCRMNTGTTMAEMPLALWIILTLCFALLILATETMRYGFFWNACREAAQQASQCQTFQNNSAIGLSSVTTANNAANNAASAFNGITITSINVYIVSTNVASGVTLVNPRNIKLVTAADINSNIYDVMVELNGQIEPIVPMAAGVFGPIPGLTGPYPVVVRSQYKSEVPQGLNQ